MKKTFNYIGMLALAVTGVLGCKETNYIEGSVSPYIANFDLRKSFKGNDITLTSEFLKGATAIKGVVVTNFTAGNAAAGLLIVQNARMVGNGVDSVRGIAVNIGDAAASYTLGDSVHINILGAKLGRKDGVLQIQGLDIAKVEKIASNRAIKVPVVNTKSLNTMPDRYESTLVTVSNAVVKPEPAEGTPIKGDHIINDGFENITLHTAQTASFANSALPPSANFTGIISYKEDAGVKTAVVSPRTYDDVFELPLVKPSPVIITGYMPNPAGADASADSDIGAHEYIQLMATRDIDFSVTPFSLVTTNNAGANTPTGVPTNGWATGGTRTYKFNLTSGTARKGEYFYVGGNSKLIWGILNSNTTPKNTASFVASTSIASAKWITSVNYAVATGDFGSPNTNLLANSGNIAGIAVFEGTTVTSATVPLDVIMFGGAGNFYAAGPPVIGYRITNTDYYSTINPSTRASQIVYGAGSNTNKLGFQVEQTVSSGGGFVRLGGIYNTVSGRWEKSRALKNIPMALTSVLTDIEEGDGITVLKD